MFLTGNDRAEFEHVYGPLTVDPVDPRFVLVDEDTEDAIRKFPAGVPANRGDDWRRVQIIRAAELDVAEVDHDLGESEKTDKVSATPKGPSGAKVAESGTPIITEEPTYTGGKKPSFGDEKDSKSKAKK